MRSYSSPSHFPLLLLLFPLLPEGSSLALRSRRPLPLSPLSAPQCGLSSLSERRGRIIGGRAALEGEIPWVVSIQSGGTHFCGGSIIAKKYVLSAAHCFTNIQNEADLSIILGTRNLTSSSPKRVRVERVKVHESFDETRYLNDIALLRLEEELTWETKVRPICLPEREEAHGLVRTTFGKGGESLPVLASGWGRTWGQKEELLRSGGVEENELMNAHSERLKVLGLIILGRGKCDQIFSNPKGWAPFRLAEGQLCAGVESGQWEEDTAKGDSGGPLAALAEDGRWTLVGITSFGTRFKGPGVYAKVSTYIPWIEGAMREMGGETGH